MEVTQLAIVENEFRDLKTLRNKKIQCGRTNTSRDNKSHVDHDVTSSFKVTRKVHVIGNSWNDFLDLKNLGNNKTFIAVGQIQAEMTKVT